ncbi:hypothetical protein GCM10023231_42530 [Olivibacter ginsenosidimutans]|uniref:Resolvase/invertase-type recombinase catalytic domain-containing protein n=1 Tax=Olivibacter ginsenosidimutans TaxID=1176537 RepID=A0ABP9CDC0_9SPHI
MVRFENISRTITWKYEQEIRERTTFEKSTKNRSKPFDPKSLVGIILGAKMLDSDKETIKNLVLQLNKYNIEIIDSYIDVANNRIRLKKNGLKLR